MNENISVILIARNEEQNISRVIEGLLRDYDREILEIIVVDDASTDKTASIAQSWASQNHKVRLVKRTPPCGVGRALKEGFANIDRKAGYALTMDSDFIENIKEVRRLIARIEKDECDGVIGSRFIQGSRVVRYPFSKRIMNRSFHFIVKSMFGIRQNDLSNNFKLYKADILRYLPWKSNNYSMNAETGILPILAGYRIGEVPISWVGRAQQMGKSKFNIFKEGWSYIQVIFYAWNYSRRQKAKQ